ncbi:MAG: glycosyltransferase [Candidatus Moranbacteria bacterium]|nr:glycosyltransferase [Candidatus Moranbacteria bacterium]
MTSNQSNTTNDFRQELRVALVHDFLNQYGGAERVLEALTEIFPDAPIYTLLYDPVKMRGKFKGKDIQTSFLQKFLKFLKKRPKWLLPFLPTAPETFNLRDFDLVISSSGAWSKGIIVKPKTVHVCYCHSPMRFVWDWNEKYLSDQNLGRSRKLFARLLLNYVRIWDKAAADRPDFFIANSKYTAARIRKYYGRESVVVYPPVEIKDLEPKSPIGDLGSMREKFFLIVSRLSPYKKIEVAIEAMNKLNLPLTVIGEGEKKYVKYLKSVAGPKTKILGWKSDGKTREHMAGCRAFVFPGEDDFGITPVEAMSFGKPVIALRRGGARETVVESETGEFFDDPVIESLADAVRRFVRKESEYDAQKIRIHAEKFSKERFIEEIKREIEDIMQIR